MANPAPRPLLADRRPVQARARRAAVTAAIVFSAAILAALVPGEAAGELASSQSGRTASGFLGVGGFHTCAVLDNGTVRCWGVGNQGRLGYGNAATIGDTEVPSSVGTLDLGTGRTVRALSAGNAHTCAILDTGALRCWGFSGNGELGLGNTDSIGDDELPGSVGPVSLGAGRTVRAIAAGSNHVCAILDTNAVRCWGAGGVGQLGYGNTDSIGDDELPSSVGTVDLGAGRTARAITAGEGHTCAILDNGAVRCWGYAFSGQLGYGNMNNIGDDETPGTVGPVNLGVGRTARAITAGALHTCAILDNGTVRCWGYGFSGQLGYGNTDSIGDDETPDTVGPVNLGIGRTAKAISAGSSHTCAILDNGTVRCWGYGFSGQLGYGNTDSIGDNETPDTAGPVNLGAGRTARAIAVGDQFSCALLDNGSLRCWGDAFFGQLGLGNTSDVGDDETPDTVGTISLGRAMAIRGSAKLAATAKPKRDRKAPFRFTVTGTLAGSFVADSATCAGTVKLSAKKRAKTVGTKSAKLAPKGLACSFKAVVTTKRSVKGRIKITARFAGTSNLKPAAGKTVFVRAG